MPRPRRLLCVSVPLHGHINPLLEPARLLVQQGQSALFVCYEEHRSAIEAYGIPFKSLGPDCIDRKNQSHVDPTASKKAKMLAQAALFTGELWVCTQQAPQHATTAGAGQGMAWFKHPLGVGAA